MWTVQFCDDGVRIMRILCLQLLVKRELLGNSFNEAGNHPMVLILPRLFLAPMAVEVLLNLAHLLGDRCLGIFLHTGVDGGIDTQSAAIQIIAILRTPVIKIIGHGLPEILRFPVIIRLHTIFQLDVQLLQGVTLSSSDLVLPYQIVDHHIATFLTVLRIRDRIIIGSGLQHSHQYGGLLCFQLRRCGVEIGLTGCLDTKGIGSEIHGVGIHCEDIFLTEDCF